MNIKPIILSGGSGKNILRGGSGGDTFLLWHNGYALIEDYNYEEDFISVPGFMTDDVLVTGFGTTTNLFFEDRLIASVRDTEMDEINFI